MRQALGICWVPLSRNLSNHEWYDFDVSLRALYSRFKHLPDIGQLHFEAVLILLKPFINSLVSDRPLELRVLLREIYQLLDCILINNKVAKRRLPLSALCCRHKIEIYLVTRAQNEHPIVLIGINDVFVGPRSIRTRPAKASMWHNQCPQLLLSCRQCGFRLFKIANEFSIKLSPIGRVPAACMIC